MELVKDNEFVFNSEKETVTATLDGMEVQVDVSRFDLLGDIAELTNSFDGLDDTNPLEVVKAMRAFSKRGYAIIAGFIGEKDTKKLLKGHENDTSLIMTYLFSLASVSKARGVDAFNRATKKATQIFNDIDNIVE